MAMIVTYFVMRDGVAVKSYNDRKSAERKVAALRAQYGDNYTVRELVEEK